MWKSIIKKYENDKLPYNIVISDNLNAVIFESDNENEIKAIKQYFNNIWNYNKENLEKNILSIIKSKKIYNFEKIILDIDFSYKFDVFYDRQPGFVYEDADYYICMRIDKKAIISFNKENHNIFFGQADHVIKNILLSQLIKEPLSCERKKRGQILLHCSACTFEKKAIIFPAQKGAGKSTLLMGMLSIGCNYLGNDSLFLYKDGKKIVAEMNPHALRIGRETIQNNPILSSFFSEKINCDDSKMLFNDLILNEKIQFVPDTLLKIWKRDSILSQKKAEVRYIIFPHLDVDGKDVIKKISKEKFQKKFIETIKDKDHAICWLPFYNIKTLLDIEYETANEICNIFNEAIYSAKYAGNSLIMAKQIKEDVILKNK